MAGLRLRGIRKIYPGGFVAVKDFNLTIDDKEFIVLVGPSGCGKSTTLRMIAGLEDISEGELYIDDVLVNDVSPKDRDIAMVFQNYALYPHMTVYDNMAFGLKLRKVPTDVIAKRVKAAAEILGIEELLQRKPKALSGGQRQRVALGRVIVREPRVFLMDEPLSNLDAKLRVQMRAEIAKLHKRLKTTFIYVTHDQTEAMTMGTRIVIMNDGEIQQIDSPKALYDNPVNMFVAGFIGSPQMNFLPGVVVEEEGRCRLRLPDGNVLQLSEERERVLREKGYLGKEVVAGIRPESLHESQVDPLTKRFSRIRVSVEVAELMGSETLLYSTLFGRQIVARVVPDTEKTVGDEAEFHVHWKRIHVFDKETELNVMQKPLEEGGEAR